MTDAIDGTGVWATADPSDTGYFDGGRADISDARWDSVEKGTAYMNVPMYALYEYFRRAHQVTNKTKIEEMTETDKIYSAVHGWDEGWAFWAGQYARKLDTTTGEIDDSDGKLVYGLAEKRDKYFDTDVAETPAGSVSMVNYNILAASQVGRDMLYNFTLQEAYSGDMINFDGETVMSAYECIEKETFIPMIQGCLQYAYKCDRSLSTSVTGKGIGEMYTFCAAMIPMLDAVDSAAATTVMDSATPTKEVMRTNYTEVRDAIYSNLNAMGYKCTDIGVYSDDTDYVGFKASGDCDDDSVTDPCINLAVYDEYDASCTDTTSEETKKKFIDPETAVLGVGVFTMLLGAAFACYGFRQLHLAKVAKVPTTEMSSV